jgi:hypothetical protein
VVRHTHRQHTADAPCQFDSCSDSSDWLFLQNQHTHESEKSIDRQAKKTRISRTVSKSVTPTSGIQLKLSIPNATDLSPICGLFASTLPHVNVLDRLFAVFLQLRGMFFSRRPSPVSQNSRPFRPLGQTNLPQRNAFD